MSMLVSQSGFFRKQSLGLELGYWVLDMGFPCDSAGKESACNEGQLGLIPGLGRSPGEGKGYPLQYFGLQDFMDYINPWGCRVRHD